MQRMEGDDDEGLRATNALGQPIEKVKAADVIVTIYTAACPLPSHCAVFISQPAPTTHVPLLAPFSHGSGS